MKLRSPSTENFSLLGCKKKSLKSRIVVVKKQITKEKSMILTKKYCIGNEYLFCLINAVEIQIL